MNLSLSANLSGFCSDSHIYYCNLHGIPSLTTPAASSILISTYNTTSSKHNYDELLNIHQYFPHHNIVLYATLYTFPI